MTAAAGLGAPTSFQVFGSQNLTNWTLIAFPGGLTWADSETKTITW